MKFNPFYGRFKTPSWAVSFRYVVLSAVCLLTMAGNAWGAPNVIQILVDPVGGLVALTEDKGGLFYSNDGGKQWAQGKGLPKTYLCRASAGPKKNLFMTTSDGVYCSVNGGADWFQSGRVNSAFIAFAPSGDLCLVKVWGEGLFKTSTQYFMDRGATHGAKATDAIVQIENEITLKSLAIAKLIKDLKQKMGLQSPDTTDFQRLDTDKTQQFLAKIKPASDELKALKKQAAQLKEVGGAGLQPIQGLPDRFIQCISFSQDEEAFVGFFGKGVYVSRDGGLNWVEASQGLENRDILAMGSSPSGIVFAGTYGGGLFRCSSKETIWSRLNLGLKNRIVTCLAFGSRSLVLVGTRGEGMRLSHDGGNTWNPIEGPLAEANVQAVAVDLEGTLWAGVYGSGLFFSRDEGKSWFPKPFAYVSRVVGLATNGNGDWYAAVTGLGLLRSSNKGENWTLMSLPFPLEQGISIAFQKDRLWVASRQSGPFFKTDGGKTWKKSITGLPEEGVHALRADPKGSIFVTSVDGKGLYQLNSQDAWKKISADDGHDYSAWDLLFLPNGEAVVWGYNDVLFSRDGLKKWHRERIAQAFKDLWVDQNRTIWTRRQMSTFAFTENGLEFPDKSENIPEDRYTFFVPFNSSQFAAIRSDSGIDTLQLVDKKLKPLFRGIEDKKVLSITVDGTSLLAGTENGLWVSENQGQSWRKVDLQP